MREVFTVFDLQNIQYWILNSLLQIELNLVFFFPTSDPSNVCSAEKLTKRITALLLHLVSFSLEQILLIKFMYCVTALIPLLSKKEERKEEK